MSIPGEIEPHLGQMFREPVMTSVGRVVTNFIDKYGVEKLEMMLGGFQAGRSYQSIADELGVTKERVLQWRNLMGRTITVYLPEPELIQMLEGLSRKQPTSCA